MSDLRHALRGLLRQPSFTLTSSVTLALGIGGVAAMAALVQTVLLRPLPWPDGHELVVLREHSQNDGPTQREGTVNPGNLLEWRDRSRTLEDVAGWTRGNENLGLGTGAIDANVAWVTGNFFRLLEVAPAMGRGFAPEDGEPGAADVMILGHGLWKRAFAGDPAVVGRKVLLGGTPTEVIGVMPADHDYPTGTEAWVPLTIGEARMREMRGRWMTGVGRLRNGVTLEQARVELVSIAGSLSRERPERNTNMSVAAWGLQEELVGSLRPALVLLTCAAGFVLLVACANVGNLLLARGLSRRREIALRAALGASRARLVRLLLAEAAILSVLGAAGAVAVAHLFVAGLARVVPGELPAYVELRPDALSLAVGALLGTVVMIAAALAPALQSSRLDLAPVLRDGGPGAGVSRERRRLGRLFVASEVALACLLLVGTGLLLRSLDRLVNVDKGFRSADVFSFQVSLPSAAYPEAPQQVAFFDRLEDRLSVVPGVAQVGAMSWRPLGAGSKTSFRLLERPAPPAGEEPGAEVRFVTPGLFDALGVRLVRGRDFTRADAEGTPPVVVVNRRFAQEWFPGQDPIGRRIGMEWHREMEAEIVGVVGDMRLRALEAEPEAAMYWSHAQVPNGFMTFFVASDRPLSSLEPELRRAVAELDPTLALLDAEPLDRTIWASVQRPVFTTAVATAFAALALALAAVGLFGIMSRHVGDRRGELAVRLALGAAPREVVRLVLREALALAVPGALVGLAGAAVAGVSLRSQLFGTSPTDPVVHVSAVAFVVAVAMATALVPAMRASRIAPAAVLRAD